MIVWNLSGNTQLWTEQLAQQACNVAKLSTVQNVALAKKNSSREAGDCQEAKWNKGYRCPIQIHYTLSPKHALTTSARESSITIAMQTLSKFIKALAKHFTHLFSSYEIQLDHPSDANSWGLRQQEHNEQLTTPKLRWYNTGGNYYKGSLLGVTRLFNSSVSWMGPSMQPPQHLRTSWGSQAV